MPDFRGHLVLVPYGWAAEEEQRPQHGEMLQKTVVKASRQIGAPVAGTDLVGQITHGPWAGFHDPLITPPGAGEIRILV